ncbi:extracellular serine proteinase-like, partial [Saccoglossus kowalevskii]|uniref:Proprotein convertase subtilisin/kexin type 9-like n=1 Tax=Saccoglossus kowalevskii TaxID=10224 RepID=A0ABM0MPR4_SACKO
RRTMKYIVVVQALCAVLVYTLLSSESLIVPDEYLVIMSNDSTKSMCDNAIAELINLAGESATNIHQYTILKGFSVNIDKIYEQDLKQLTGVAYVERQVIMTATDISWGQDRIDQRLLPLNGVYDPPGDGTGVNVYVLDTGIRQPKGNSDNEFDTRVTDFYDTQSTRKLCNSHGTRMAGIIGSHSYGVATKVKLHSVRVLNCENAGRLSDILAGLDFVLANGITPGVILMALSGPKVESLDQAIASADAAGFVVITAAGNNGDDACFYSPASSDK